MAVARVLSNDPEVGLIGFAGSETGNPDAFVVLNLADRSKDLQIRVLGSESLAFEAYRSSEGEQYAALGRLAARDGTIAYEAPPQSVTTFYAG